MKIIILDGFVENPGDLSWNEMASLGELTIYDRTDAADIVSRIGDAPYIFTNKTPISNEVLEQCPNLKFIGMLSTGYNVVDVKAARRLGVAVANIPTYGTYAVAQFAIALLLELCHRIGHHDQRVKQDAWKNSIDWCFWDYPLVELADKTIGIVGLGKIGYTTANIAIALGMKVLAFDEYPKSELENESLKYVTMDELITNADVISLHCPLTEKTVGMINTETISKMKEGVMIINNSRGPLIVEADLLEALDSGKVAGAGLDVLNEEPPVKENLLLKSPKCIVTPHISWAPKESRARLMETAVENLSAFLRGIPLNIVN